ncbi:MAG: TIR domain-containing protein, partial [Oceanococcus sp.]
MLKVAIFSASERVDICENLASRWGQRIEPVIWKYDVFAAGETAADAITRAAQSVDFAVCVMTADDELSSRGSSHWVPRDNVIMEYGLCAGALGTDRAILLVEDDPSLKLPTNSA